jgi:hypothetical protein
MKHGSDSVSIVVEEEKHETSASIQALWFLGGARPVGTPMPFRKGRMAHSFGFGRPGENQHPHLSMLSPGERAHQGGGFSLRYSFEDAALPKADAPQEFVPSQCRA